jgi:hypothetical protein
MTRSHRLASGFLLVGGCLVLSACSSIKSRIYDVDGVTSSERQIKCLRGIPTTMDVPTHVRITIEETKYFGNNSAVKVKQEDLEKLKANLQDKINGHTATINTENAEIVAAEKEICRLNGDTAADATKKDTNEAAKKTQVEKIATSRQKVYDAKIAIAEPEAQLKLVKAQIAEVNDLLKSKPAMLPINATRQMSYQLITQKELYTVDFKRPLSGSNDLKLEFGDASGGQFLKSVGQTTVDTTITDIGDLVEKTAAALPKLLAINAKTEAEAQKNADENKKLGLYGISGVVAVQCFDILDENIQAFLEQYINNCWPGCPANGATHTIVPASHKLPAPRPNPER